MLRFSAEPNRWIRVTAPVLAPEDGAKADFEGQTQFVWG